MRHHRLFPLAAIALTVLCLNSCGGEQKSVRVYDMGNQVVAGNLRYTVFETQWLPQLGSGDNARIPANRFFLIRLSVVNSGSDDLTVPNLTLTDDQGKIYEELSNGEGVTQWVGYLRKVRPADSISGNIIFDATPKHYSLNITDENGENPAIVDLPLTFNAETPRLPAPANTSPDFNAPVKK